MGSEKMGGFDLYDTLSVRNNGFSKSHTRINGTVSMKK